MNHRERIIAVLKGEKPDMIPSYRECPMDVTVFRDLLPPATGDLIADQLNMARFFDNSACNICIGGQGIGLRMETLSKDDNQHTYRFETGSVWHESYQPVFCREATSFPIETPEDVFSYQMPDAYAPGRFDKEEIRRMVEAFHAEGYFVEGEAMGAWYGIYYFLTRFENILMWMAVEPEAAHALFDMTRKFSIDSARQLLDCGVDCIATASDLGTGSGLLFSPAMFREYVFPWLKELADLCHERGAFLNLHSHGHIEDIMDDIVAAGVDAVNPIGPSDHNDLEMFKRKWGEKITIYGGISTTINNMSEEEIAAHVAEVIDKGRKGGRFIPRSESGIPVMPAEKARYYVDVLKKERKKGYE